MNGSGIPNEDFRRHAASKRNHPLAAPSFAVLPARSRRGNSVTVRNWHSVSSPPSLESIHFAEKHPDKAKASLSKILKIPDLDTLQSAYDTYAVSLVNRSMVVPVNALTEAIEAARETGTNVRKKARRSVRQQLRRPAFQKRLSQGALGLGTSLVFSGHATNLRAPEIYIGERSSVISLPMRHLFALA